MGPDGSTSYAFLVRGLTHIAREPAARDALLAPVRAGDALSLRADVDNQVNAEALHVVWRDEPLGWVPDALIGYVRTVMQGGGVLTVLRCNGPDQPPYLRVVAEMAGSFPSGREPLPLLAEDLAAGV